MHSRLRISTFKETNLDKRRMWIYKYVKNSDGLLSLNIITKIMFNNWKS